MHREIHLFWLIRDYSFFPPKRLFEYTDFSKLSLFLALSTDTLIAKPIFLMGGYEMIMRGY